MSTPLEEFEAYETFIDGLVARRQAALSHWVKERGWPQLPENARFNQLLDELTPEQKDVVAEMIQQGRDSGIHDTLVNLEAYTIISPEGIELAKRPYGFTRYYDFVRRREGDPWEGEDMGEEAEQADSDK